MENVESARKQVSKLMKIKKILTIVLSIIVGMSIIGCKATQNTEPQDDARIKIVTSLPALLVFLL